MRTTKEEREYLRAKYSRAKDYDDDVRRDVLYLLDDANTAEYLAAQLQHPKGEDPAEWPEDLRVREWPEVTP